MAMASFARRAPHSRSIGIFVFVLALGVAGGARAWPTYADGVSDPVPNASRYKCLTCHTSQYGGYPSDGVYSLNPFGIQFQNNGSVWAGIECTVPV